MRTGRLRSYIIVQSQPEVTDDFGDEAKIYNDVFSAKCNFRVVSGTELLRSGLSLSTEAATILMRFDSRLKHDHLILHNKNRYEVVAIKPSDNHREMIVTVTRQIR